MKRICTLLLCALLLCLTVCVIAEDEFTLRGYDKKAGGYQYIQLGEFPQDADSTVRPILWRVLSVEDDQAYLLSEYVLFNNRIHPDDKEYIAFNGAFNQTEMFKLLNGPFEGKPVSLEERAELLKDWRVGRVHIAVASFKEQAFTEKELEMLITDEELGTVFLAAANDLKNSQYGFVSDKARKAYGSEYAKANGLFVYQNGSSPYWTRTQSSSHTYGTRCTKVEGSIGYIRCVVMNEGCRPAIRLNLKNLKPLGGSGVKDDPFVFSR